jgi:hypothetical protein
MKTRGFILTMDTMVALMLAAGFIVAIMYLVTMPQKENESLLYSLGGDFLAVSDNDGTLLAALLGNTTPVNSLLKSMPNNICMNLSLLDTSGNVLFSNSTGCREPTRYVLVKRTIVNATTDYTARLRIWYGVSNYGGTRTTAAPTTTSISTTTTIGPRLEIEWVTPTVNADHIQNTTIEYKVLVCCRDKDCGTVITTLDPQPAKACCEKEDNNFPYRR